MLHNNETTLVACVASIGVIFAVWSQSWYVPACSPLCMKQPTYHTEKTQTKASTCLFHLWKILSRSFLLDSILSRSSSQSNKLISWNIAKPYKFLEIVTIRRTVHLFVATFIVLKYFKLGRAYQIWTVFY